MHGKTSLPFRSINRCWAKTCSYSEGTSIRNFFLRASWKCLTMTWSGFQVQPEYLETTQKWEIVYTDPPSSTIYSWQLPEHPISQASWKNAKRKINFSFFLLHTFLFLFLPFLYHLIIFNTSFSYPNPKSKYAWSYALTRIQSEIFRFLLVIKPYGSLTGKLFVLVILTPL